MADLIKTREQLEQLGKQLRETLEAGLSPDWDTLERPFILAHALLAGHRDKMDSRCHAFESLGDALVGLLASGWVEPYLKLHADLTRAGYTSNDNRFEFGNDAYVWVAADRELPEKESGIDYKALFGADHVHTPRPRHAKLIVLNTQSKNFAIILNESYGRWDLHIREFWPDVREAMAGDNLNLELEEAAERSDLTLMDAILLANAACQYGDDLPGVSYPTRPHLATLLDGNLMAKDEEAGISLRYGDARDKGYVLSLRNDSDGRPEAKDMHWGSYGAVGYVALNLSSAIYVFGEEHPEG